MTPFEVFRNSKIAGKLSGLSANKYGMRFYLEKIPVISSLILISDFSIELVT